jgi:hypothetical protein
LEGLGAGGDRIDLIDQIDGKGPVINQVNTVIPPRNAPADQSGIANHIVNQVNRVNKVIIQTTPGLTARRRPAIGIDIYQIRTVVMGHAGTLR